MPRLARCAAGVGTTYGYATSGTVETITLDLGATPSGPVIYRLDTTLPTNTTVTVSASRSSADGATWSSWAAPSGVTLTSPLNRYYQVRASLTTLGRTVTPVLNSLAIMETIDAGWDWDAGGAWA